MFYNKDSFMFPRILNVTYMGLTSWRKLLLIQLTDPSENIHPHLLLLKVLFASLLMFFAVMEAAVLSHEKKNTLAKIKNVVQKH